MATKVKLIADGAITPDQITLTTASTGTNTTAPATTAFVQQEISALVDSSPEALNTLNELAAALGDDANFSTTVTNSIATKAPLASPTFTGDLTVDTDTFYVDSTNNRVGIGTTSPAAGLQVSKGLTNAGGPAAGASTAAACFGNDGSDDNYGLVLGADGFGKGYISAQRTDGTATTYDLLIQPNGGNVGIGTSTPQGNLSVTGSSAAAGDQGIFQVTDGTGANTDTKIVMGVVASDYGWIQAVKPGTDVFDLALQPNGGNLGIGTSSPDTTLEVRNPTLATDTVNTLLTQRWSRAQTGAVKWGNSLDLLLGSYESGTINSRTRVDFKLADGSTDDPDTTVMTLQANGNVGIGTDTPSNKLHVNHAAAALGFDQAIRVSTNSGNYTANRGGGILMQNADVNTAGIFGVRGSSWEGNLAFYTHTSTSGNTFGTTFTEKMRITHNGNVGIGQISPDTTLHIGDGASHYVRIENAGSGDVSSGYQIYRGSSVGMMLYDNPADNATSLLAAGTFNVITGGSGIDFNIDTDGRVGINRTPAISNSKLEIGGADDVRLIVVEASGHTGGMGIKGGTGSDKGLKLFSGGQIKIQLSDQTNVAYTGDGLFNANARPSRYKTGGSGQMLLGYQDNGSGLYSGAIGLEYDALDGAGNVSYVGGFMMKDTHSGTIHLRIETNGNMYNTNNIYTSISDSRIKSDIIDASSQWDDIKALRVRKYKLAHQPAPYNDQLQIGVIAQELESAGMNGLIDEIDPDEAQLNYAPELVGEKVKIVKYSILYMKAIKALQEAMTRIETLEARVTELES